MNNKYKNNNNLYERKKKGYDKLHKYYPYRLPVIIQKSKNDKIISQLPKEQFLIPADMNVSSLIMIIRNQFNSYISPAIGLYLFTESGYILSGNDLLSKIYDTHKDEDKMLYLFYCSENTFG